MVVLFFVLLNHFERYLFLFGYEHTHGSLKNDVEFVSCVVMFEHRVSLSKLFHGHRECNLLQVLSPLDFILEKVVGA